jgi:hypothetical protein
LDKHLFIHQRKYVLLLVYNALHGKPLRQKNVESFVDSKIRTPEQLHHEVVAYLLAAAHKGRSRFVALNSPKERNHKLPSQEIEGARANRHVCSLAFQEIVLEGNASSHCLYGREHHLAATT